MPVRGRDLAQVAPPSPRDTRRFPGEPRNTRDEYIPMGPWDAMSFGLWGDRDTPLVGGMFGSSEWENAITQFPGGVDYDWVDWERFNDNSWDAIEQGRLREIMQQIAWEDHNWTDNEFDQNQNHVDMMNEFGEFGYDMAFKPGGYEPSIEAGGFANPMDPRGPINQFSRGLYAWAPAMLASQALRMHAQPQQLNVMPPLWNGLRASPNPHGPPPNPLLDPLDSPFGGGGILDQNIGLPPEGGIQGAENMDFGDFGNPFQEVPLDERVPIPGMQFAPPPFPQQQPLQGIKIPDAKIPIPLPDLEVEPVPPPVQQPKGAFVPVPIPPVRADYRGP